MLDIEYIGKCLLVDDSVLVVGDLHFGFGEAARESGVLVVGDMYKEIIKEFNEIFEEIRARRLDIVEKYQGGVTVDCGVGNENKGNIASGQGEKVVKKILLLGDVKHVFGTILSEEWKHIQGFFDYLKAKCSEVVVVKGNHDAILDKLVDKKNKEINMLEKDQLGVPVGWGVVGKNKCKNGQINIVDYYINENVCYLHGDKKFDVKEVNDCSSWIVGHGHPAIVLNDNVRREKYKCFLVGKHDGREVVVVPSFFPLVEGSDPREHNLGLAWDFSLGDFEVKVVDGLNTKWFGKLKDVGN